MGIWISCGIAALIAAASAYVAYLAYTVEGAGGGFWFFTAFALCFGAAAAGVAIGALGRRVLLAVLAAAIVSALVGVLF
ncbi:MAG: hypothetical protein HYY79_02035 [Betaproteobacteria bacterium]|nr:hypothetical protein [Betaproteobacteria bacterium]